MSDASKHWRAKAEELRTIAEACQTVEARQTFQRLALAYDLMAERVESRSAAASLDETSSG
jgi:hypothetical protein